MKFCCITGTGIQSEEPVPQCYCIFIALLIICKTLEKKALSVPYIGIDNASQTVFKISIAVFVLIISYS